MWPSTSQRGTLDFSILDSGPFREMYCFCFRISFTVWFSLFVCAYFATPLSPFIRFFLFQSESIAHSARENSNAALQPEFPFCGSFLLSDTLFPVPPPPPWLFVNLIAI